MNTEISSKSETNVKKIPMQRFIKGMEKAGNKLPHPFTLFTILAVFILILSYFLSKTGISVTYMAASRVGTEVGKETTVSVVNLLSKKELQGIIIDFVNTYIGFFPIGIVLVMTFGIAVAEQSGLIMALMKKTVLGAPAYLVTYIICIVGVCANIASDAGIVFAPAIGGAVFYALGRHPIAGIMAGYVAAYGGFSANLMVVGTDALLAGITESVMTSFGITAPVHPLMNWYVMAASTLVIALIVTLITEKIITPILGEFDPVNPELMIEDKNDFAVTEREVKGLKAAGIASVIYLIVLLLLTVPKSGFLRNDSGGLLPSSPLISGILFLLFAFFLATGITYGKVVGTIKSGADIARFMQSGLVGVAGFLVVCLPASMFITWFGKSNIATIMAIKGAELLKSLNLSSIPILILYVLLCGLIDLFITSGSSKWILIAPIFVPMLAILGLSPATTQMGYRIADSTFDIISPVSAYIPVVLGMMEKYRSKNQNLGVGTVISLCMPYSIILTIFWIALLCIWVFLGIPLGPGVSPFM